MTNMIALKSLHYGGKRYKAGDTFAVKAEKHVRVLKVLKKADCAFEEAPKPKAKDTYKRRDMTAEQPAAAAPLPLDNPVVDGDDAPDEERSLYKLTNAELKEIAEAEGVALDSRETKADYVAKILTARATTRAEE